MHLPEHYIKLLKLCPKALGIIRSEHEDDLSIDLPSPYTIEADNRIKIFRTDFNIF